MPSGSAHPLWKAHAYSGYRGEDWPVKRLVALERAHYACERCGKPTKAVHHKRVPVDRLSWDNSPENLECLCKSCHFKEHAVYILVPVSLIPRSRR